MGATRIALWVGLIFDFNGSFLPDRDFDRPQRGWGFVELLGVPSCFTCILFFLWKLPVYVTCSLRERMDIHTYIHTWNRSPFFPEPFKVQFSILEVFAKVLWPFGMYIHTHIYIDDCNHSRRKGKERVLSFFSFVLSFGFHRG